MAYSLSDPFLLDFMRDGLQAASGATVSAEAAMRNPAFFRAMSLISNSIGMLPVHVLDNETKAKAKELPLYRLLHRRPNSWQTAFDFRSLMQLRAMTSDRPAVALIV
ncbi:MAG: phage portal protein, partial [Brevundimonas sp.]